MYWAYPSFTSRHPWMRDTWYLLLYEVLYEHVCFIAHCKENRRMNRSNFHFLRRIALYCFPHLWNPTHTLVASSVLEPLVVIVDVSVCITCVCRLFVCEWRVIHGIAHVCFVCLACFSSFPVFLFSSLTHSLTHSLIHAALTDLIGPDTHGEPTNDVIVAMPILGLVIFSVCAMLSFVFTVTIVAVAINGWNQKWKSNW